MDTYGRCFWLNKVRRLLTTFFTISSPFLTNHVDVRTTFEKTGHPRQPSATSPGWSPPQEQGPTSWILRGEGDGKIRWMIRRLWHSVDQLLSPLAALLI